MNHAAFRGHSVIGCNKDFGVRKAFHQYANGSIHQVFLGTTDANPLTFMTNGIERIHINAAGNVGIGTTNPNRTLSVQTHGGNAVEGMMITHGATTSWGIGIMGSTNSTLEPLR